MPNLSLFTLQLVLPGIYYLLRDGEANRAAPPPTAFTTRALSQNSITEVCDFSPYGVSGGGCSPSLYMPPFLFYSDSFIPRPIKNCQGPGKTVWLPGQGTLGILQHPFDHSDGLSLTLESQYVVSFMQGHL